MSSTALYKNNPTFILPACGEDLYDLPPHAGKKWRGFSFWEWKNRDIINGFTFIDVYEDKPWFASMFIAGQ
jgi:hypothetical protein